MKWMVKITNVIMDGLVFYATLNCVKMIVVDVVHAIMEHVVVIPVIWENSVIKKDA